MTTEDLKQLSQSLKVIKKMGVIQSVTLHSGWEDQRKAIVKHMEIIPHEIGIDTWEVMNKTKLKQDLLVFCNVLMYVREPYVALKNIFASCKYLLLQDIIIRNRGENIFGDDGDCMRYSFGEIKSNYIMAFNLKMFENRVVFFNPYIDDNKNLHFITLMKGDL